MSDDDLAPLIAWAQRWNVSPGTMRVIAGRLLDAADFAQVIQDAGEGAGERIRVTLGDLGLSQEALTDLMGAMRIGGS